MDYTLIKNNGQFNDDKSSFCLGVEFANARLTRQQLRIINYLYQRYRVKEIAGIMCRSEETIKTHIRDIKIKLKCNYQHEIMIALFQHGFTHILQK